jgi:hypothetical protein
MVTETKKRKSRNSRRRFRWKPTGPTQERVQAVPNIKVLRAAKLVGQYFGRLHNLREIAACHGKRWVKNRGTRAAVLAV